MKLLWITNNPMPPICPSIGITASVTGGWMFSLLKLLCLKSNYSITVATVYIGNEYIDKVIEGVRYIILPLRGKNPINYNQKLETLWKEVKENVAPDIVHIHGSEFPFGLAYVHACGGDNVVVSIQGLISEIAKHYCDGLPLDVIKKRTFRDILRKDSIVEQKYKFTARGNYEIELLKSIHHIIGRTDWDRTHVRAINPNAKYYFCGETLRSTFYNTRWNFHRCEPHTIFVSQGSYPIKGLHIMLQALPYIINHYPDCKMYVGGTDITALPWYRISGYGKYLKDLISELNLETHVIFCGQMTEDKMRERYLKSNVFICPSSIENSSNSVGEAQVLRMPLLCSFVGGLPDIVDYNRNLLYRFNDEILLAEKVIEIFNMNGRYKPVDFNLNRYDAEVNLNQLELIYKSVFASVPKC